MRTNLSQLSLSPSRNVASKKYSNDDDDDKNINNAYDDDKHPFF